MDKERSIEPLFIGKADRDAYEKAQLYDALRARYDAIEREGRATEQRIAKPGRAEDEAERKEIRQSVLLEHKRLHLLPRFKQRFMTRKRLDRLVEDRVQQVRASKIEAVRKETQRQLAEVLAQGRELKPHLLEQRVSAQEMRLQKHRDKEATRGPERTRERGR